LAEGARQGDGIIHLGTPTNPTLYTARVLRGPSTWQRIAIAFVATEPTVRISLLGQAASAGQTVEYDGIRFLPPGRNPVLLMAALFARFLPHLTLDPVSVAVAAARRHEWLFSGYIPDPGRTDALLTRMSQECFCTLFKDLDGVYRITADDPDHLAVLHLDSQRDIFQESLEVQGMPMDEVYTDFYLWYQRVTTQVTTSQAGQYAAVLFVTPDDSISQYPELQTLCSQAADTLQTRTRFDFFCDFIADPGTADLLLSRFVRQLSVLRREVALEAALPALPLSMTDHVAVRAPLLGLQPFVGETRRYALAFAAQAPGLAVGLTLRQSGLVRGVWETWDAPGLTAFPGSIGPPGAARVRETWEEETPSTWSQQATLSGNGAALCWPGGPEAYDLYVATWDPLGALATPMVLRSTDTTGDPQTWIEVVLPHEGAGTALATYGTHPEVGALPLTYAALHYETTPGTPATLVSEVWRLRASGTMDVTSTLAFTLSDPVVITAMQEVRGYLFLLTSDGFTYRYSAATGGIVATIPGSGGTGRAMVDTPDGLITVFEHSDGLIIRRGDPLDIAPGNDWEFWTIDGLTGEWCSNIVTYMDDFWIATSDVDGTRTDIWRCTPEAATLVHSFTERAAQRASVLLVAQSTTDQPCLYVGRASLNATPLLELWRYDGSGWQLEVDLATVGTPTTNSITGLAWTGRRGTCYVATASPYADQADQVVIYVWPTPD
jgi:hypothetical protein